MAFASGPSHFNVNDYNLVCISRSGNQSQVYLNSYTLSVGLRLSRDGGFLCDLETLLVQPVSGCKYCYDVTAATRTTRDHIYIARIRTGCAHQKSCQDDNLQYSVALYETLGDSQNQELIFDRSACIQNLPVTY